MKKRRLSAILAVMVFTAAMTACGNTKNTDSISAKSYVTEENESITADTGETDRASSCNYSVKTGTVRRNAEDEENNTLINISYPEIMLGEDSDLDALDESLQELNQEKKQTAEQDFADYKAQAEEEMKENDDFMPYEMTSDYYIRRADENILSFCSYYYEYTGGAHGYYSYGGYNYNVKTGEMLFLSDVITDQEKLVDILNDALTNNYPDVDFFDLKETLSSYAEQDFSWCMDYTGITFFFNPYELASFADGSQTVTLPFADYPELFSAGYTVTPDSYCVDLINGQDYSFDLNGDGEQEILQCIETANEDEQYESNVLLQMTGEGFSKKIEDEEPCYSMDAVLFHLEDGSNYVYIMKITEDDYESATVYKIANNSFKEAGTLNLGFKKEYTDEASVETHFTNPEAFEGEIRTDALSTYNAYTTYHLGVDGLPVMSMEWYISLDPVTLKLKKDMTFDLLDAEGVASGNVNLEKGTKLTIFRTDNNSFVDFSLEDDRIVRTDISLENYPQTVGRLQIDSVFSGMKFAG